MKWWYFEIRSLHFSRILPLIFFDRHLREFTVRDKSIRNIFTIPTSAPVNICAYYLVVPIWFVIIGLQHRNKRQRHLLYSNVVYFFFWWVPTFVYYSIFTSTNTYDAIISYRKYAPKRQEPLYLTYSSQYTEFEKSIISTCLPTTYASQFQSQWVSKILSSTYLLTPNVHQSIGNSTIRLIPVVSCINSNKHLPTYLITKVQIRVNTRWCNILL